MKKTPLLIGIALLLLALGVFAFVFFSRDESPSDSVPPLPFGTISAEGTTIKVEIAKSAAERSQGLSGRESLPEGHGMVFFFPAPARYGIWMPRMGFALDIVWIDPLWRVVDIARDVTPDSYPKVFHPISEALYVLEVPAGSSERYGWKIGTAFTFSDRK